jgi:hypothetical protein
LLQFKNLCSSFEGAKPTPISGINPETTALGARSNMGVGGLLRRLPPPPMLERALRSPRAVVATGGTAKEEVTHALLKKKTRSAFLSHLLTVPAPPWFWGRWRIGVRAPPHGRSEHPPRHVHVDQLSAGSFVDAVPDVVRGPPGQGPDSVDEHRQRVEVHADGLADIGPCEIEPSDLGPEIFRCRLECHDPSWWRVVVDTPAHW